MAGKGAIAQDLNMIRDGHSGEISKMQNDREPPKVRQEMTPDIETAVSGLDGYFPQTHSNKCERSELCKGRRNRN
jgi:hypothetical protein